MLVRATHHQCEEVYRRGIVHASRGELVQSVQTFWEKGWFVEGKESYLDNAAMDFMRFSRGGGRPETCMVVAMTHRECALLTEKIRERLKGRRILGKIGAQKRTFSSFNWTIARKLDIQNYRPGMEICVTARSDALWAPGLAYNIRGVSEGRIHLDNGTVLGLEKNLSDHITVGKTRKIEICCGDRIQFHVSDTEKGIADGGTGVVLKNGEVELESGAVIGLGEDFCGLGYGWVSLPRKCHGRACKNVVVAAEKMDAKSFHVSLSVGRENIRFHCPDSPTLQYQILKNVGDIKSAMKVLRNHPHLLNSPVSKESPPEMTYPSDVRRWIEL